jgi:nitrogen-specific signal transduction histidine kinase
MRYSLEETMGEQAFIYLDKVHSPIFLVDANGMIKRINRAGKKLLSLAHVSVQQIEEYIRYQSAPQRVTRKNRLKIFSTRVALTNYTLIEVIR